MTHPGALMAAEIVEQPDVWRRQLDEGRAQVDAVARRIAEYDPSMVLFVAPAITPPSTASTSPRSSDSVRPACSHRRP
jgi:hypothetical protein